MFCPQGIVQAAATALRHEAARLDLEQSVRGLDALLELQLHPVLARGLSAAGFGVRAEQPYPTWSKTPGKGCETGPARPQRRDRLRCDLVLLPDPGAILHDPVAAELAARRAAETAPLFVQARSTSGDVPAEATGPEEAFWLEVKAVGQFTYSAGIPVPNQTYTSELLALAAADIPKLAGDPRIRHAGLLIVLFTRDQATAQHDLETFRRQCLQRGRSIGMPALTGFSLVDRIGNGWCAVAILPVR